MIPAFKYERPEKIIFGALLSLNVLILFTNRYFPTHDGGAHLYNARIIRMLRALLRWRMSLCMGRTR